MIDGFEFDGDVCFDFIIDFIDVMMDVEFIYNVRIEMYDGRYLV